MAHVESPGDFLISWPFGSANLPAGTEAFDPLDPRLCQQAAHVSMEEKIQAFENVVKDFMAFFLRKGQAGMPILAAMGKSFQEYYSRAAVKDAKRCSDLSKCVLAISALAQQTAITPDQFKAFEALDQGKLSFASALQPCLADVFWEEQKVFVWDVAAYESTTFAILEHIVQVVGKGEPVDPSQQKASEDAWELSQKKWTSWTQKLRPGAWKPVADALARQLVSEAGTVQTQATQADAALALAKRLADRAAWLTEVAPCVGPQLTESRRVLATAITGWDAQVKMSKGNGVLRKMITMVDAGEDVDLSMVQQLRAEYDGCVGICPLADIVDDLEKAARFLTTVSTAQMTSGHAQLAVRVNTLLMTAADAEGGGSVTAADAESGGSSCADSPGTRPSHAATDNWTKTAKGFELHETLGEATQGNVRIAKLAQRFESYQDQSGHVMEPFKAFVEAIVEKARQELTEKEVTELTRIVAETSALLAALATKAGGKPDGSWKEVLDAKSTWDEVQQESPRHRRMTHRLRSERNWIKRQRRWSS